MAGIEQVTDLVKLGHNRLKGLIVALQREASGGLATRLAVETMRGPLQDAHSADAGPVELDHFDTVPSTGAAQITGTVGGPDILLQATTSNTNEAGLIVIECEPQWVLAAGAGGWTGWGVVSVQWGIQSQPFVPTYTVTPSGGYGARQVFAHDFRGHRHKPLHGRTIDAGGGITAQLIMRPLGPPGALVVWPGADLQAISSAACTLLQKMTVWNPRNYGPIHVKGLFAGKSGEEGEGRKSTMSRLFGNGKISNLIGSLTATVENPKPGSTTDIKLT